MILIGDRKFLNTKEASRQFGFSIHWFRRHRWEESGPPYVKLPKSKSVFYDLAITEKWFLENMREE